jgi:sugar phosphate isomerase/epimerase
MAVTRVLGADWATAHGPSRPRELAMFALDLGFAGLLAGPTPRPVDWSALRAALRDLPFRLCGMRVAPLDLVEKRPDAGLASHSPNEREQAMAAVKGAVGAASRLGIDRVLLEPGQVAVLGETGPVDLGDRTVGWTQDRARTQLARRNAGLDRALDAACRSLHQLCKAFPENVFCLGPSRSVAGLGGPDGLAAIFDDLPGYNLAFWHDAAIAARRHELLLEEQGTWLDRFGDRLAGVTIADAAGPDLYLPPGAGVVDYPLIASYVGGATRAIPAVLELDPTVPAAEIPGVHAFLTKFGL